MPTPSTPAIRSSPSPYDPRQPHPLPQSLPPRPAFSALGHNNVDGEGHRRQGAMEGFVDLTRPPSHPPSSAGPAFGTTRPWYSADEPAPKRRRFDEAGYHGRLHEASVRFTDEADPTLSNPIPPRMPPRAPTPHAPYQHRHRFSAPDPAEVAEVGDLMDDGYFDVSSDDGVEQVDLTGVKDDADLHRYQNAQRSRHERLQQQQQSLQVKASAVQAQATQEKKPTRIGGLHCVICMDNFTNITATHCGHLFCHTCINEALIAGENQGSDPGKGTATCPFCRTPVFRHAREGSRPPRRGIIALEFKLGKSQKARGKERTAATD